MKPSLGASERWFPPKSKVNVQCVHVNSKIYFHKNNHLLTFSKPLLCIVELDIWFKWLLQGRIQDFFLEGVHSSLIYFNTNKPHSSFFFLCRIPVVLENRRSGGMRTPCTLPLDPPLYTQVHFSSYLLHPIYTLCQARARHGFAIHQQFVELA